MVIHCCNSSGSWPLVMIWANHCDELAGSRCNKWTQYVRWDYQIMKTKILELHVKKYKLHRTLKIHIAWYGTLWDIWLARKTWDTFQQIASPGTLIIQIAWYGSVWARSSCWLYGMVHLTSKEYPRTRLYTQDQQDFSGGSVRVGIYWGCCLLFV